MDNLIEYIKDCIKPRDETEFCEVNTFDRDLFDGLKQDGIMISDSVPDPCDAKNCDAKNCEYVKIGDRYLIRKCFRELDWYVDSGSGSATFNWDNTQEPIYRRLLPPPDETVNHSLIIKSVMDETDAAKDKVYVEYGVRWGTNVRVVSESVREIHGVDLCVPQYELPSNCKFWKGYTDDFSKETLPSLTYHFAFVDADHAFSSAYSDFLNLYKYLQPGGYVFLHDTYPCAERFLDPGACNDCYKTPMQIKKTFPEAEIVTLPLNPGVTIVRKVA